MPEHDPAALAAIGFDEGLAARARALAAGLDHATRARLARVTEVHRETVVVDDGTHAHAARPHPKLVRLLSDSSTALAVGDWVFVEGDGHERWIVARVPPATHLARRDADGRRHPIVSNVDVALLVMGLDADFNPRRLERFVALVHHDAIAPVVVLTKADVARAAGDDVESRTQAIAARLGGHIAVVAVDATDPSAALMLGPWCEPGRTLVLLGSSGAGKSTLTNTLVGAAVRDTGPVREVDGRGMHTTTARTLLRLPGGACIVDTPGVRTLKPDGGTSLAGAFADVEALAGECRFNDCRHESEPGCAVRDRVDPDRLRNWHKLEREHARDTMTALDRRRMVGEWKARGRAAAVRARMKRGFDGGGGDGG
ncbi:MAG: ribosome small subunit-dependent GTPase A [Burkholderiales bacterium]|nr:ribosome small subunit-dependent GTPase A [Burkholderiales bacterium]MCE7878663.1 ribosome small subunit-dependent GTPase A [Betaproteobacteria bacterium PRO3]